ncbi:MAG: SCP2 sterol-binding domain-containing protein [Clostridium sp.]|nr:SCP2 sterol-binding domain-containing protein [Clostridium sp.]MCM1547696.1 SCP2 sterol-binding domain-containing protein [Ruminococcus sp.]
MTFMEIVEKAKKEFGSADVSNYEGHLALQINITGEGEGTFYAEISDGKLYIEPYDYKDNDAVLTADGKDILNIFNGTLDPVKAFENGKLTVTGDLSKALSIQPVIENNKNKKAAKPAAKKTAAKKTAAKTEKTSSKAQTKSTAKASAKNVKAASKPAAPKAEAKKEEAPAIIGLTEPKKAPAKSTAPKAAAKKPAAKAAKGSTKSAKTSKAASKNKKG